MRWPRPNVYLTFSIKVLLFAIVVTGILCTATGCRDAGRGATVRQDIPPSNHRNVDSEIVTYSADIAEILWQHCCPCHRPGQSAPFSLLKYQDVQDRAAQIRDVIDSGYMPPWLPGPADVEYDGERRLTEHQIALIRAWVAADAPEGHAANANSPPEFLAGWQLGKPDLVVGMPQPYTLPASGPDVIRNFIIPVPIGSTRFVRGVEIQPGSPQVVHHGVLLVDRSRSSRWLDADDPEIGFDGMESGEAHSPDGHFPSWTPGKIPRMLPEGMAWRLESGDELVLQLHLLPSGKPEPIQAQVGLFFSAQPPTRLPEVMRLGSKTLDIPAGEADYVVEDSFVLPVDVQILSIYPHAHYLGKEIQLTAVLPTGDRRRILWIEDWDFNWQDEYVLAEPMMLPNKTELLARFRYDNSTQNPRRPRETPQRVLWGPQSSDEMGDVWVQVLPLSEPDRQRLAALSHRHELAETIACFQQLVRSDPTDVRSLDSLGIALARADQPNAAQRRFEQALSVDPQNVKAHFHLGLLWAKSGQLKRAVAQFQRTLQLDDQCSEAHTNLATAYFKQQALDKAEQHVRQAIQLRTADVRAHYQLATVLFHRQDHLGAKEHLLRALEIQPDNMQARKSLDRLREVMQRRGR